MIQEGSARRSLDGLSDIVPPPEVSMWPCAPGWILVGCVLVVLIVVAAAWLVRRHGALRYRRAALAELEVIRSTGRIEEVPTLLKRVALVAYPRDEVASLSGAMWARFLDRTGGAGRFAEGAGETLSALAYGGTKPGEERTLAQLLGAAEVWIRAQGPPPEVAG